MEPRIVVTEVQDAEVILRALAYYIQKLRLETAFGIVTGAQTADHMAEIERVASLGTFIANEVMQDTVRRLTSMYDDDPEFVRSMDELWKSLGGE